MGVSALVNQGSGYGSGDGSGCGYGSGSGSGDGSGFGSGYGFGSGSGYGDGYGDGSGFGSGYGFGSGSGYGDGYGDGYGSGSGDGSGYGDGYGDGYGPGSGSGSGYWHLVIEMIAASLPKAQSERISAAMQEGVQVAYWRSDRNGKSANGGTDLVSAMPGLVQEIVGPLALCSNALHATLEPHVWKGERLWIVALHGEVKQDGDKLGALKREILAEVIAPWV